MKKNIIISIIVFILFITSVTAISKYYSPIVSGQNIENEGGFAGADVLANNMILGTTQLTNHRTTFQTCQFGGSGDNDYRYANVDDDGLIYLTDDDFINIFDDDCNLVATHIINGTLQSQPYIFDVEGDGFKNIYYISNGGGNVYQINEIELINGVLELYKQTKISDRNTQGCFGLYCDRDPPFATSSRCFTVCDNGASNVGRYITIKPFDLTVTGNFSITGNQNGFGIEAPYSEATNSFKFEAGDSTKDAQFFDRTFPAIYGMDIDQDDSLEILPIYPCGSSPYDLCVSSIDITDQTLDYTAFLDTSIFTDSNDIDIYSSGGFAQVANSGSLGSNGEIFVSYASESGTVIRKYASVFNSVGSEIKNIIDVFSSTIPTIEKKISNFAVADIDRDLKNDYCIAFNDTARNNKTKIHCYSGLTNNIMTNCTINGWESNNPIHLSLLNWDTISTRSEAITTFGIFDLSENNGGVCNNLRPSGFTGLTSASEGVMLPVAVGGDFVNGNRDTAIDLIYYGADGARLFKTQSVEGVGGSGAQTGLACGARHIIFCDDFNYDFGLTQRNWQVLERDGEVNTSITPIDNRLNATDIKFQSFLQNTNSVDVNYSVPFAFPSIEDERILTVELATIVFSFIHPVVSHSFKLKLTNANGIIEFRVDDGDLEPSIQLRFRGSNVTYVNDSATTGETLLCLSCITPNVTHTIKVTQFFGKDNEREQGFSYPFNVSFDKGFYRLFIDNEMLGDNIFFTDNGSSDFSTWLFTKNKNIVTGFTLDDVFTYRGTSQIIDNSDNFFTSLQTVFGCQVEENFCSSTSECCSDLTCVNNACASVSDPLVDDVDNNALRDAIEPLTKASNISLGTWWLIIMMAVGLVVFVGTNIVIKDGMMFGFVVFLITEFLLLMIGTKLGFLSVGIIISIIVIALVVIGIFVARWFTGTSNG